MPLPPNQHMGTWELPCMCKPRTQPALHVLRLWRCMMYQEHSPCTPHHILCQVQHKLTAAGMVCRGAWWVNVRPFCLLTSLATEPSCSMAPAALLTSLADRSEGGTTAAACVTTACARSCSDMGGWKGSCLAAWTAGLKPSRNPGMGMASDTCLRGGQPAAESGCEAVISLSQGARTTNIRSCN
jgi:hypothetical protein